MIMRLLSLILLCFVLQNCRQAEVYDKNITYIRTEDLKEMPGFKYEDLLDSCTYIPLETSNEVLLGNIHQLKVTKNHILVSDYNNDALFVFDRQGKFQNNISRRGRAPGEYQHLGVYCLTPAEDTVILYDEIGMKLHFYTIDDHFVRTVDLHSHLYRDTVSSRRINGLWCPSEGRLFIAYNYMHRLPLVYSLYDYQRDTLYDIASMLFSLVMPFPGVTVMVDAPYVKHSLWGNDQLLHTV